VVEACKPGPLSLRFIMNTHVLFSRTVSRIGIRVYIEKSFLLLLLDLLKETKLIPRFFEYAIDPGNAESAFFTQFPAVPDFNANGWLDGFEIIKYVLRCWSYKRRLTSPPYTAGIKWFVGGKVLFVSVEAMLAVSIYSARVEQKVW
jgi:hypothetical protein